MKIIITGGAGFIGSSLARRLLSQGHIVYVIDNLSTGLLSNIYDLQDNKDFIFIEEDILKYTDLSMLVQQCDIIYHLAASVGAELVEENPISAIEINLHGTELILRLICKYNKRIIFLSTSEVYGKGVKIPFEEEDDKILGNLKESRWGYAYSKSLGEILCFSYYKKYGTRVTIIRPFNTIGKNQVETYGMVVPRFVRQAVFGKNITVQGDGEQTRCFGYVTDVVKGIMDLSFAQKSIGEVYNIGDDREISINALAQKIKTMAQSNSDIVHLPYNSVFRKNQKERRVPSLKKIQKCINYIPSISLEEGLEKIIKYMQEKK